MNSIKVSPAALTGSNQPETAGESRPVSLPVLLFVGFILSCSGCQVELPANSAPSADGHDSVAAVQQPSSSTPQTEFAETESTKPPGAASTTASASQSRQPNIVEPVAPNAIRFATFNVALHRKKAGDLVKELEQGSPKAAQLAAIVQTVRPQVLLVNELDHDVDQRSMELLHSSYFKVPQKCGGDLTEPITYMYRYTDAVNTGEPSDVDLDGNGRVGGPTDCFGFGVFPGQYGMAIYSQFPIRNVRTFRLQLWKSMPDAALPRKQDGSPYYSNNALDVLRLSSKSHWDVSIKTPLGMIHFLASHPTPPVFDGPEDRNGRRNHDEIRMFADYISGGPAADYLVDDAGVTGGLPREAKFVIAGDLNADPQDGGSYDRAIQQLLEHDLIAMNAPASAGAEEMSATQGGRNLRHKNPASHDTGDFGDRNPGNLRADYVLPSKNLVQHACGVFWPQSADPLYELVTASDHRLVWIDVSVE